jgi:AraC-like DNA-binding protein
MLRAEEGSDRLSLLLDTATLPLDARFDAWVDGASRYYHPVRISSLARRPYRGRMAGFGLGTVQAFRVSADPNTVLRTPNGIAASDPERLDLYVMRKGRCRISQGDRGCTIAVGDLTSLDSSVPYVMRSAEPFELISFSFPKPLLRPNVEALCRRTGLRIPADSSLGGLMGPFLCGLVDRLDEGDITDAHGDFGESLFGLLRALALDGPYASARAPSAALLPRLKAYIDMHLDDVDLGPESIASAHYISVRYLHKLFKPEGVSVSEWIRHRRLERCQRDLVDPALADQTIVAIAGRWGFTNGPHFSRLFRAAYSCSPREFRARGRTSLL